MTGIALIERMFSDLTRKPTCRGRTRSVEIGQRDVIQASKREAGIVRYELSDDEWATIGPMLPNKVRGVPRVDDRRVLNGISWVLRSGAPWRDLPSAFGPHTTCYDRFVRWRRAGVWSRIMDALAAAHDRAAGPARAYSRRSPRQPACN